MKTVVKLGSSSLTDEQGELRLDAMAKAAAEVAAARTAGHEVVVVSSGAVAAGLPALGIAAADRPKDAQTLQAVSAVGQARLMQRWNEAFAAHGLVAGQVLMAPLDFMVRTQYLHARSTFDRLLSLGAVPVVNENDATADDEIRFGDNDRIAALVAHLVGADTLVLLTDTDGLMDADPRLDEGASLIEEIAEIDAGLEQLAGGAGTRLDPLTRTAAAAAWRPRWRPPKWPPGRECGWSSPGPTGPTSWPTRSQECPAPAPWCRPAPSGSRPGSSGSGSRSRPKAGSWSTTAPSAP